jgi:hypothetical protein
MAKQIFPNPWIRYLMLVLFFTGVLDIMYGVFRLNYTELWLGIMLVDGGIMLQMLSSNVKKPKGKQMSMPAIEKPLKV